MKMKKINKTLNLILPIITIGFMLIVWSVIAKVESNEYVVPTVEKTMQEFVKLFGEKKFYTALYSTIIRSIIAFLLSFFISFILAYCASKKAWAEKLILPIISINRTLPTIAIAWLLVFWTNKQIAPVVITMLVVLPTSYTQIKGALDGVNRTSIEAGKVDGAGWFNTFIRIEVPQIAPDLFSVIGSGLALNFKLMVAAEVLAATIKSLGNMINLASPFEVARTLALSIVVLVLGLLVEFLFNILSKKSAIWRE